MEEGSDVLVVWLDEIRWFLEDMNLTDFVSVLVRRKRRRVANFASALPWLLSLAVAKDQGEAGGFEEITTGLESLERNRVPPQVNELLADVWSPPNVGYMQPPVVAVLPCNAPHQELLPFLEQLRFHCGGRIYVFTAEAPPNSAEELHLDGSDGWSKSCKHVDRCQCPRTPVSPYAAWGWCLWRAFHAQLPGAWHVQTVDHWPAVAQSVTVVVFHQVAGKVKVLKFWRDATAGGHFSGWSVPGGSILTGKDLDLWCTAQREWNEEMMGYPWDMAVGDALTGTAAGECIEGSWVYRRGRCLLCIASLGEVFLANDQRSDRVFSTGWSPRYNATLYAPAIAGFYGDGDALQLRWPEQCVTPSTLHESRQKIHTEGWPFMEHSGKAYWVDWDDDDGESAGTGAAIWAIQHSANTSN